MNELKFEGLDFGVSIDFWCVPWCMCLQHPTHCTLCIVAYTQCK